MKTWVVGAWLGCVAGLAQAQAGSGITVSPGLKLWNTHWTSWNYAPPVDGSRVLRQVEHEDKIVLLPLVAVRWNDWLASVAAYRSTRHREVGNTTGGKRSEFDANVGYAVLPRAALTLGWKQVSQGEGDSLYKLAGPVLGANASAPLGQGVSLYGTFALGRLKPKGAVRNDADYRLLETGVAYTMGIERWLNMLTFTVGWRNQVLVTKNALSPPTDAVTRDARDLTEGLTFGVTATF